MTSHIANTSHNAYNPATNNFEHFHNILYIIIIVHSGLTVARVLMPIIVPDLKTCNVDLKGYNYFINIISVRSMWILLG